MPPIGEERGAAWASLNIPFLWLFQTKKSTYLKQFIEESPPPQFKYVLINKRQLPNSSLHHTFIKKMLFSIFY
jgi:hypothetical protein